MRYLLSLLLLLASFASVDAAETRKFCIFTVGGHTGTHGGNFHGHSNLTQEYRALNEAHAVQIDLLNKMGVPFDIIDISDSSSWGPKWLADDGVNVGPEAGMSDEDWFAARYFAWGMSLPKLTTGAGENDEVLYFFQDGDATRTQADGPLSGTWSIPGVAFCSGYFVDRPTFNIGITIAFIEGANYPAGFLANGDSLETVADANALSTADTANVTRIWTGENAVRDTVKAWRWKDSAYFFKLGWGGGGTADARANPQVLIMGLNKVFEHAGYYPPKKLTLQLLIDHPLEASIGAAVDTLSSYAARGNWKINLGVLLPTAAVDAHEDRGGLAAFLRNPDYYEATPHSHWIDATWGKWGSYMNYTAMAGAGIYWDWTAFSDTALIESRYLLMEAAITDTLGLPLGIGPNRYFNCPGGGISDIQASSLIRMGVSGLRAFDYGDSIGKVEHRRRLGFETINPHREYQTSWMTTDVEYGGGGWAHVIPEVEFACSSCSTGAEAIAANVAYAPNATIIGHYSAMIARIGRSLAGGQGFFFHGKNMRGSDPIIRNALWKRLLTLQRECPRMFRVQAAPDPYRPRTSYIARATTGTQRP